MGWREQLRPASFRGVPFLIEGSDQQIGRRAVQTEYPGRDEPFVEDMGRRAWADSFTAYILGDDHLEQAQRLAEALNRYGPGELVHPFLGTRLVQIGEVSLSHKNREGGQSTFTIALHEAGPAITPNETPVTDIALQESCDIAEQSLLDKFEEYFHIEGLSLGLVDELSTAYDGALETIAPAQDLFAEGQNRWAQGQGMFNTSNSWIAIGQSWTGRISNITSVMRNPSALGGGLFYGLRSIMGIFGHVGRSSARPASSARVPAVPLRHSPTTPASPSADKILDTLHRLPDVERTRITPVNLTESRKEQIAMQGVLLDLVQGATVIAAAQASSLVDYRDQDQAQEVQAVFIAAIEKAQLQASDTVYQALEQVRIDLIKDLSTRGTGLPSVTRITPAQTLPALVQAYRLYGDSRRNTQLVERNGLSHPGFVPAGERLEVLR
ncbi:DNA circularization protein [Pseudomonas sp. D47]|uniref:DNA circularization protein n=1 Tax=Pseudomonas sp. D47 TaxID=3159447 RepID=UPI00387B3434